MKKFVSAFVVLAFVLAMLPVAAFAGNGTALYLAPGDSWLSDGARFAAYYFEGSESGWVDCADSDSDGYYECVIPEGYSNVIFCRMNPATAENIWENKWNKTIDLTIGEGDLFTVENPWNEAYEWNATGSWSTYETEAGGEMITLVEPTTVTLDSAYDSISYNVTPEVSGTLTINLSAVPGWRIMDYMNYDLVTGVDDGFVTYEVEAGVFYQFALGCYDEVEIDYAPGDLTYSVTLTPGSVQGGEGEGDGDGEEEIVPSNQTIYLGSNDYAEAVLPVNGTITVVVDAAEYNTNLYVDGDYDFENDCYYTDWYIENGMLTGMPDAWGSYTVELLAGQTYTYTVHAADSATGDQYMYFSTEAALPGSYNNPVDLVMGENSGSFVEWEAYFFGWTATEDGVLTITANSDKSPNWMFYAMGELANGESYYSETLYSDAEVVVSTLEIPVSAGDYYMICVMDPNYGAGTVYIDASFTAGEVGGGEEPGDNVPGGDVVIGGGDISVTDEPSKANEPWTYTFVAEGPGNLHVVIGECNPGWRYKIEYPDGTTSLYFSNSSWSVGPDYTHILTDAGQYKVMVWAYSSADYDNVDGTISATITFTPDEAEVEIPKEEYIVSDVLLGLGENSLTLDETAITTVYEFCPEETGVYKFTVDNESALVGYWGAGSFFVWDQTENKTNFIERELDAVGQSIMVGVSGVEGEFILTVEKLGEAGEIVETVYIDYVNTHIPSDSNLIDIPADETVNNVDITKPQTVVKDENGIYHLGSVNGPVLYVNLISEYFDITNAFFGGYGALTMRGQYTDEDGTVYNYDFLTAMRAYANIVYNSDYENGLYPLTEDLLIFLKGYGSYQGWYNPNMTPFEAIQGEFNEDSAWLVSCCYFGDYVPEVPDEDPENNPNLGDYSVAGLVVAMMAATVGAVVLTKKKEF